MKDARVDDETESEAIRAALGGDAPAGIEVVWRRYAHPLFMFLLGRLRRRADAEDALQEVFVKIARKRRAIAAARNLDGYVYAIARHEAATLVRRRVRREAVAAAAARERLDASDAPPAGEADEVRAALAALPAAQRDVVMLKLYGDMTFDAIARALRIPANTAASRYRYAIARLRTTLLGDRP